LQRSIQQKTLPTKALPNESYILMAGSIIDLTLSSDDEQDHAIPVEPRPQKKLKLKRETMQTNHSCIMMEDDGDVCVVEPEVVVPKAKVTSSNQGDTDVALTGIVGKLANSDYPHSRFDCAIHKFGIADDSSHCEKCYCWVCDIPAKDCSAWAHHCHAKDTAHYWQSLRAGRKKDNPSIARASHLARPCLATPIPTQNATPASNLPVTKAPDTEKPRALDARANDWDLATHPRAKRELLKLGTLEVPMLISASAPSKDVLELKQYIKRNLGAEANHLHSIVSPRYSMLQQVACSSSPLLVKDDDLFKSDPVLAGFATQMAMKLPERSASPTAFFEPPGCYSESSLYVQVELEDKKGYSSRKLKRCELHVSLFLRKSTIVNTFELGVEVNQMAIMSESSVMQYFLEKTQPCFKEQLAAVRNADPPLQRAINKMPRGSIPSLLKILESNGYAEEPSPPGLSVELRPYQRQSLRWMLDAERSTGLHRLLWHGPLQLDGAAKPLYFSPLLNTFSDEAIPASAPRGGFLCEEMGLGKTVEVVALVLANPAPVVLPSAKIDGAIPSRATLVICPVSLVGQWAMEAKSKCTDSVKIYQYHGSNRNRDPKFLANQDIVVTTYQTLGSDFSTKRKRDGAGGGLTGSPLHQIVWHRIILDESHNIKMEKTGHTVACTALRGILRWCATGTPFGTTVADLSGQFKFLHFHPLSNPTIFKKHVLLPFERSSGFQPIASILKSMMMRHTKAQKIGGQTVLALPPRNDVDIKVALSEEERQLYKRCEENALKFFTDIQRRGDRHVAKATFSLLSSLLPLRQICAGGRFNANALMVQQHRADEEGESSVMKHSERTPSEVECVICQDIMDRPVETPCRHWFCHDCIICYKNSPSGNNG